MKMKLIISNMKIASLKLLTIFGLLVLGLAITACVPEGQKNTDTGEAVENAVLEEENSVIPSVDNSARQEADDMVAEDEKNDGNVQVSENGMTAEQTRTFDITGKNFAFSQTEIKVKKGDRVKINFKSIDGFHDWVIDEFNAKTGQVNTGGSSSVEFLADREGTFDFYCSVGRHRDMGMVGKLIVE